MRILDTRKHILITRLCTFFLIVHMGKKTSTLCRERNGPHYIDADFERVLSKRIYACVYGKYTYVRCDISELTINNIGSVNGQQVARRFQWLTKCLTIDTNKVLAIPHGPLYQIRKIAGCVCREFRERFPRHWFQMKPLVSDPGMHHGTCVTHVPWCMSGSLTRGGCENIPGILGACATCNFKYMARGPLQTNNHDLAPKGAYKAKLPLISKLIN